MPEEHVKSYVGGVGRTGHTRPSTHTTVTRTRRAKLGGAAGGESGNMVATALIATTGEFLWPWRTYRVKNNISGMAATSI